MSLTDLFELELELERLFERYVSDMASRWTRAADADIAALEALAGRALPRCYRWMLLRLGRGWSSIAYGSLDMSAQAVVEGHACKAFPEHEGMMGIALDSDTLQPQLRYYDLANATDDDAPVYIADPECDELSIEYESLREFIGAAVFNSHRLLPMPSLVDGVFIAETGSSAIDELLPFILNRGFYSPLRTGRYCTLYDSDELVLSSYRSPSAEGVPELLPFRLGGRSPGELRDFLGLISTSTSLRPQHLGWSR